MQIVDALAGKSLEPGDTHRIIRVDDVKQMMRDLGLFLRGRFRRADIHAPVHLVGVRVHDFRALAAFREGFRYGDAQSGLA